MSNKFSTILFIDTETTGLVHSEDKIIEFSWILTDLNFKILSSASFLISDFIKNINDKSYKINNISYSDLLKAGIPIKEVLKSFNFFLKKEPLLVGYNLDFDFSFIFNEFELNKINYVIPNSIDLLKISKDKIQNLENYKLETVCKHLNINNLNFHRSYDDALACIEILKKLDISIQNIDITKYQPGKKYLYNFIKTSLLKRQEVSFTYAKSQNEFLKYIARPYSVTKDNLDAYDLKADFIKKFNLSKILNIQKTGNDYEFPDSNLINDFSGINLNT
ncbi:MAG TPA: hypothetical protein DDW90_02070 [Cyanobacteria bacterium UBA9971]|nr:hypothetical protein [Cyanobacteria bacterium UBA9971]